MLFGQAQVDGNELPPMTRIEINTFQDLLYDKGIAMFSLNPLPCSPYF